MPKDLVSDRPAISGRPGRTKEDLEQIGAVVPKGVTLGERHPEMPLIGL
jgi:hypothetical protein